MPGQRSSRRSIASSTVAASTSSAAGQVGEQRRQRGGQVEIGHGYCEHRDLDRRDARAGSSRSRSSSRPRRRSRTPGRCWCRSRGRARRGASIAIPSRSTPRCAFRCGRPSSSRRQRRAGVARAPDGGVPVRHAAGVAGVERDHVEAVAVVRVRRGGEAEVARQPLGDLDPRAAAVVAAVHAAVVLLVQALVVGRRHHELVHAVADLRVLERPVGAQAAVARRPRARRRRSSRRCRSPARPPRSGPASSGCGRIAGMPRWPGGWFAGSFQLVAAGLAVERAEQRPGGAAVAALEDAGRLGAGEHAAVRRRQPGDLRQPQLAVLAVAEALARELPRLAEVGAAPDPGAVPLARRGRVDRARLRRRARRGRSASRRRTGRARSSRGGPRRSRG